MKINNPTGKPLLSRGAPKGLTGMVYGSAMNAGEIQLNEALMQEAEKLGKRLIKN